ncbi:MAG: hypothetical protein MHMPM18_002026 [Marteilia pararefringens]
MISSFFPNVYCAAAAADITCLHSLVSPDKILQINNLYDLELIKAVPQTCANKFSVFCTLAESQQEEHLIKAKRILDEIYENEAENEEFIKQNHLKGLFFLSLIECKLGKYIEAKNLIDAYLQDCRDDRRAVEIAQFLHSKVDSKFKTGVLAVAGLVGIGAIALGGIAAALLGRTDRRR